MSFSALLPEYRYLFMEHTNPGNSAGTMPMSIALVEWMPLSTCFIFHFPPASHNHRGQITSPQLLFPLLYQPHPQTLPLPIDPKRNPPIASHVYGAVGSLSRKVSSISTNWFICASLTTQFSLSLSSSPSFSISRYLQTLYSFLYPPPQLCFLPSHLLPPLPPVLYGGNLLSKPLKKVGVWRRERLPHIR